MSPQILERAFHRVDFDRELVFRFFVSFSLFEKALKENGFYQRRGERGDIQPDWNKFAEQINKQFTMLKSQPNQTELATAVDYLMKNAPKKQVLRDGYIQFIETRRSHDSDTEWLAVLINRVRNNLFHGAKFEYDHVRDTALIRHSLTLLEAWAHLNPGVQKVLEEIR